ncbi:MAG: PepSY domain-containing protein [Chromatiales bacterium]|nr:PepSY domain-containing protein [Chromatiales bacterium]
MPDALRRRAVVACLAMLAALSAPAPAVLAKEALAQDALAGEGISEDAAVALVREQTDGKVVRVDRKTEGGRLVYRVRVLTPDGRLREYRVDAATGALR